LFSQEFSDIKADVEYLLLPGSRPLSQGKEYYIRSQGSLQSTFIKTDFAISRSGFFTLLDKNKKNIFLTRNGSFLFDPEGYLINHDNMYVLDRKSDLVNNIFVFITKSSLQTKGSDNKSGLFYIESDDLEIFRNQQHHPFLLTEPLNLEFAEIINSEYLFSNDYIECINSRVVCGALENMPMAFDLLLKLTVKCFSAKDNNLSLNQKQELLILLKNRYSDLLLSMYSDVEYLDELKQLLLTVENLL
jgi:hypothetical protein